MPITLLEASSVLTLSHPPSLHPFETLPPPTILDSNTPSPLLPLTRHPPNNPFYSPINVL
ncbi:hypothetical protein CROQUDRAFT_94708 [Cronartium quercuum f. sp. fusiforme G11]|uniref:Uncharacterized protein n=1 Tax=Cronartium quercuum f. sp. fusiforme G11 TaxID=708437 RepID=A0A9P6NIS4_9BASI|nr:hypothetical protein CROQUDRAFT_94708 [Cronartium quercuum f. sp. fusiforme G11]